MNDEELLKVAEAALQEAVAEAEFTRKTKDLQYVLFFAQKVEDLRGKIANLTPIKVDRVYFEGECLQMEISMEGLGRFNG
jgi:hypothetical protein